MKIHHAALESLNYRSPQEGRDVFVLAEANSLSDHEVLDYESDYESNA